MGVCCQVPEGMSSYQADWFVDEEGRWDDGGGDEEDSSEEDVGGDGMPSDEFHRNLKLKSTENSNKNVSSSESQSKLSYAADNKDDAEDDDDEEDMMSDCQSLLRHDTMTSRLNPHVVTAAQQKTAMKLERRAMLLKGEVEFPDEMDTPADVPARQRFAR